MMFQIAATFFFLAGMAAVVLRTFSFFALKVALLTTLILGVYFVWRPDDLTGLANALGIARGADLVNYLSTIVLLLFIVSASINSRQVDRRLTLMARKIAIENAKRPAPADRS